MPRAVPREKYDVGRADATETQAVRWLTPWRRYTLLAQAFEAWQVIDARPSEDPENRLGHATDTMMRHSIDARWRSRNSMMQGTLSAMVAYGPKTVR